MRKGKRGQGYRAMQAGQRKPEFHRFGKPEPFLPRTPKGRWGGDGQAVERIQPFFRWQGPVGRGGGWYNNGFWLSI